MPELDTLSTMTEALIDLDAIAYNTALLANVCRDAQLMAVVKANGFGHGTLEVARTALANGATWLGVTSQTEALALRRAGIDAPILMWLFGPNEDLSAAVRAGIDISVASVAHLDLVAEIALRSSIRAGIHLKIDTGLSRNGALPADWSALTHAARLLERAGLVRVNGLWSHFANAEDPADDYLHTQQSRFHDAIATAAAAGLSPKVCHLANSAAMLLAPGTHHDLTRAGLSLYGIEPVPGKTFGLRPAMTLRAQVIGIRRVSANTRVSYGSDYATARDTTLALVPLGFADGAPRVASGQAQALVHGVRCRIAGRIAMDQFVLDVGDLPVTPGDVVTLFGDGADGAPTALDWAKWAQTNPHEILTGIGSRVPRRFLPLRDVRQRWPGRLSL
ncbi:MULTISPECIES: alanine racemase [Pandoraea]|uniref:alanine racemase n=1 Tax=Pandoraea TaxID=93217 RepID=UPI001F5C0D4E|nr:MULTISPECIES: alanine racemase [Pandoraea]